MIEHILSQVGTVTNYSSGVPFPHTKIENFLPADIASSLEEEFPKPTKAAGWNTYFHGNSKKYACTKFDRMPPLTQEVLQVLNSDRFVSKLGDVTGIPDLIADPDFHGGGMHQISTGGFLKVHTDFNKLRNWHRRLNLLVFLNTGWDPKWGGAIELWNSKEKVQAYPPLFNRAVIFSTSETSWHGHPTPLTCPIDRSRKSLALYYYTDGFPDDLTPHSTIYRKTR